MKLKIVLRYLFLNRPGRNIAALTTCADALWVPINQKANGPPLSEGRSLFENRYQIQPAIQLVVAVVELRGLEPLAS